MSQENLDLVRSIYAHWERGDFGSMDWADADIDYVIADGPDPQQLRGAAALARTYGDFLDNWKDYRIVPEQYREIDGGRVFVLSRVTGLGEASGMRVEQQRAALFQIRAGKVVKYVVWWDRDRAFADLGLEA